MDADLAKELNKNKKSLFSRIIKFIRNHVKIRYSNKLINKPFDNEILKNK